MRLFDPPQAKHFCSISLAPTPGAEQPLNAFHRSLKGVTRIREGSTEFDVHRLNLLHSAERWLLFSTSHYQRALGMLVPVAAPWAQVTLYYSSFFAANAILAMFGGWVGYVAGKPHVVDVEEGTVGIQVLQIFRNLKSPNQMNGSHAAFWDFFYDAAATLIAWAPAGLDGPLNPVNNDSSWQIRQRNEVNYDMYYAWMGANFLHASFKPAKLKSLKGDLRLQLDTAASMNRLAQHFATELGLPGTSLMGCGMTTGTRRQGQKRMMTGKAPARSKQSALRDLLA